MEAQGKLTTTLIGTNQFIACPQSASIGFCAIWVCVGSSSSSRSSIATNAHLSRTLRPPSAQSHWLVFGASWSNSVAPSFSQKNLEPLKSIALGAKQRFLCTESKFLLLHLDLLGLGGKRRKSQ